MIDSLNYPYDWKIIQRKTIEIKRQLLNSRKNYVNKKIAVLGGSTTHEIVKTLELFCIKLGIFPTFYESDYGKYFEEIMFEKEELIKFQPDVIIFHISSRNILKLPLLEDDKKIVDSKLQSELLRFQKLWEKTTNLFNCVILQNNFDLPFYRNLGDLDSVLIQGKTHFIHELNRGFAKMANQNNSLYINDIHYLSSRLGLEKWNNEELWSSFRYCIDFQAVPHYCNKLASKISSLFGKSKKVIVLDLDNTLWGGEVGDDGVNSLKIGSDTPTGESFSLLQNYLKELKNRGVLLAVCSKNEHANAIDGFSHPDSILSLDDFVTFIANWDPKSQNIQKIIKEINIGLDSAIFLDDSDFEKEEVSRALPSVETLSVNSNPINTMNILDQSFYFEPINILTDDIHRNKYYETDKKREQESVNYASYENFLKSLEMKAEIFNFKEIYLERITQLINKTNQFNLTTKRYTYEEVKNFAKDPNVIHLYARLNDKFGDNGLVSIIIAKIDNQVAIIDSWIMSCRVFKRGLEFALFDKFINEVKKRNIKNLVGEYIPSTKNIIVKDLYKDLGFKKTNCNKDGSCLYSLNVDLFNSYKYNIKLLNE